MEKCNRAFGFYLLHRTVKEIRETDETHEQNLKANITTHCVPRLISEQITFVLLWQI